MGQVELSLADVAIQRQVASANVHSLWSNWKEAGSRLRLHPHLGGKLAARVAARLLARPIPQEYDAFTVSFG